MKEVSKMRRVLVVIGAAVLTTPAAALAIDPSTWQSWWLWVQLVIVQGSGGTIW